MRLSVCCLIGCIVISNSVYAMESSFNAVANNYQITKDIFDEHYDLYMKSISWISGKYTFYACAPSCIISTVARGLGYSDKEIEFSAILNRFFACSYTYWTKQLRKEENLSYINKVLSAVKERQPDDELGLINIFYEYLVDNFNCQNDISIADLCVHANDNIVVNDETYMRYMASHLFVRYWLKEYLNVI